MTTEAERQLDAFLAEFDEADQERILRHALDHIAPKLSKGTQNVSTPAERDCKHGQLARSCNVCELESEVARQAAEIEQLKSEMADQGPCIERLRMAVALKNGVIKTLQDEANDARLEIERLKAALAAARVQAINEVLSLPRLGAAGNLISEEAIRALIGAGG